MMRPRQFIALLAALLLLFSSCAEDAGDEPAISASIPEEVIPETSEAITFPPEAEETTAAEIPLPETVAQTEVADLPADIILDITELLTGIYGSYTRTSRTETEIDILGEVSRSESQSELTVSGKNAFFKRGNEEYFLIDGYLCYAGSLGKYRIGGHSTSSFTDLFGDLLPRSAFEKGEVGRDGEDIILTFNTLTSDGKAAIRNLLGLGAEYEIDIQNAELKARTDKQAHLKTRELALSISVGKGGKVLMKVALSSITEQTQSDAQVALDMPALADYVLFPDTATVALYEAAFADYASLTASLSAFEFTESDDMTVTGSGVELKLTEKTDYAYASRIGASIDKSFDIADGTGIHNVLTHFNRKRGFSQIDGGSIFVDTTINAANMMFSLFHPFETSICQISSCTGLESAEGGKIVLNLNNDTAINIAQSILLHAGIPAQDLEILKIERAVTFITIDSDGKATSAGYSFAAQVCVGGKTFDLTREVSLEITSRGTAQVKVIYIEVEDEEEE